MDDLLETAFLTCTALALVIAGSKSLSSTLRRHVFIPQFTILADVPNLAEPRSSGKLAGRAVICGGSIAGLLSAAVCADSFNDVVIVEPEEWVSTEEGTNLPEMPSTRPTLEGYSTLANRRSGVAQTTSMNFIQPISLIALRALFPAVDEEAAAMGGQPTLCDIQMHIDGQPLKTPQTQSDYQGPLIETIYLTRDTYETLLRRLVRKYRPNVKFLVGTATDLEYSESDRDLIVGVNVETGDNSQHIVRANLVVDATGPAQTGYHKWFKDRNFAPDLRQQHNPNMYYMTATYHIPPHLQSQFTNPNIPRWLYTLYPDTEIETKTFLMAISENFKLVMTCGGWMTMERPRSPADIKDFLASTRTTHPLPTWLFELLDFLQTHRHELKESYADATIQSCSYVKYHEAPPNSIPCNYVAVGDSVMRPNPVFAQGLSLACIGAVTLDAELRKIDCLGPGLLQGFSTRYFAALAARTAAVWDQTKTNDYGLKTTVPVEGESLDMGESKRTFIKHALSVALEDPVVESSRWHVEMFLAPATDLLTPRVFLKVGWKWISSKYRE